MRRILPLWFTFAALLLPPLPAIACGGFFPEAIEDIGEIWVSATVLEVDDKGYNAILEVDRYFKGRGGKYLAVYRLPPALQSATRRRYYDTGCLYAGGGYIWHANSYGYFALKPRGNGTYDDYGMLTSDDGPRSGHYVPQDGMVEFFSENKPYDIRLPVAEFESLLLKLGGKHKAARPWSNAYPLKRFLQIETESGARYRLNPDRSVSPRDPATAPLAISPDGNHVMFRLDEGQLEFQYLWTSRRAGSGMAGRDSVAYSSAGVARYGNPVRPGNYALFSPDSNFVAIQEESRLALHLFRSMPLEGAIVGYAHGMTMREIAASYVLWRSTEAQQPLFWSANSQAVAFQDARGIWLWRILEEAAPQLIAPAADDQELLGISASGRYLRYGRKHSWILLDVRTGETWKDSLISPDESRRIQILTEDAAGFEQYGPLQPCKLPLIKCPIVIALELSPDIFWQVSFGPDHLRLVYRDRIWFLPWSYALDGTACANRVCKSVLPAVSAFAFDETNNKPAFAFDESKIGFQFWTFADNYDSVDLADYIDGPIVNLEWGQPIFYEGR